MLLTRCGCVQLCENKKSLTLCKQGTTSVSRIMCTVYTLVNFIRKLFPCRMFCLSSKVTDMEGLFRDSLKKIFTTESKNRNTYW